MNTLVKKYITLSYILLSSDTVIIDTSEDIGTKNNIVTEELFATKESVIGKKIVEVLKSKYKALFREQLKASEQYLEKKAFYVSLTANEKQARFEIQSIDNKQIIITLQVLEFPIGQNSTNREDTILFKKIFENSPLPLGLSELKTGKFVEINTAFSQIIKYKKEEIIGKTAVELKIFSLQEDKKISTNIAKNDYMTDVEMSYRNGAGQFRTAVFGFCTVEHLKQRYVVTTLYDVTQIKQGKADLIVSEMRFKMLSDNISDVFFIRDITTHRTLYVSPAFEKIWGYKPEVLYDNPQLWTDSVHPADKPLNGKNRNTEREGEFIDEYRIIRADGTIRWIRKKGFIVKDSKQIPFRMVGSLSDITEQKEAEIKLKHSEQMFQSLSRHLMEGIFRVSPRSGFLFANDAFLKMFDYTDITDLKILTINDLCVSEESAILFENQIKTNGEVKNMQVNLRRKTGEQFWGLVSCVLTKEDGHIYFDGSIVDITERKRYEDLLHTKNTELKKANTELDRFVYSASHELRAPLASIMGLVHLATIENTDKALRRYLQLINESIERLDKFLKKLKTFSANTHSEVQVNLIDFDHIINGLFEHLKYIPKANKIDLQSEIDKYDNFYSDSERIRVILNNLISNAIRYHNTDQEKPYIKVKVKFTANTAQITVLDNGVGIEKEHLDRIFEMFYRASELSTGSGLGLFIVKEMVATLGGSITATSVVGKGTKITVELPNNVHLGIRNASYIVTKPQFYL
jgi:PAS domain S-box-containing protein